MGETDLALIAHLMRRVGFGATRAELEQYSAKPYEDIVEDLLHPDRFPDVDDDLIMRYYLELNNADSVEPWNSRWIYRMINTQRPLQEKMALFWHQVFATSVGKSEHGPSSVEQIEMFRRNGLSDIKSILVDLAKDPAMLFWLDNNDNHKDTPNENWGRELLELFSMGVGNYTEQDIKMASRAFTGWTFTQPIPLDPFGRYSSRFLYQEGDHDDSKKEFLGQKGQLNGEDILDIIAKQPATARFISRHLYSFFVADEPQVPSWDQTPPQDPHAVETLTKAYSDFNGSIRSMLRVLLNSDFFKEARYKRVKNPTELVVGTLKLVGTYRFPDPGLGALDAATAIMGQRLMTPATVEGWHTGREWIDGGTLNERVNFAVNQMNDYTKPGIQAVVDRLGADGEPLSPEEFVDGLLDLVGPIEVDDETRGGLMEYAELGDGLRFDTESDREESGFRVSRMLQLIVSSIEYQFA
jgi:uncharacterized protein (DUF1800 family)